MLEKCTSITLRLKSQGGPCQKNWKNSEVIKIYILPVSHREILPAMLGSPQTCQCHTMKTFDTSELSGNRTGVIFSGKFNSPRTCIVMAFAYIFRVDLIELN